MGNIEKASKPPRYTTEQVDFIIDEMMKGIGLKRIIESAGWSVAAFYKHIYEDPISHNKYSCAQQARSELLVDEIVEIADTDEDSNRARNRIDARKWYASKMIPQKFGERLDLNVNQVVDIKDALEAARARLTLNASYKVIEEDSSIVSIAADKQDIFE